MSFFSSLVPTRFELHWIKKIQWRIAGLIWLYILYRAIFLEVTVDEAYSYYLVKVNDWNSLLKTANTHWLNSLFIKIGIWLPGQDDLWKLRLLSILCWPLYAFATIQLAAFFRIKWLGFLFFIVAITNPYLITFFSLARGYAPASTFLLLSLWQAAKQIRQNEDSPGKWIMAFVYAGLSVISNFSFFYFFAPFAGIYVLNLLINKKLKLLFVNGGWKVTLLFSCIFIFTLSTLIYIQRSGELYYGGQSDIIKSLIGSLFVGMEYDNLSVPYEKTIIIVFIVSILTFLITWFYYLKSRRLKLSALTIGIFTAIVILNLLLHASFNTPYLLFRTALPLYFPLVLGIFTALDNLFVNKLASVAIFKAISPIVTGFLIIMFCMNFIESIDVNYIREWRTDLKKSLDYLQGANAKKVGIYEPTFQMFHNYYGHACPWKYTFPHDVISTKYLKQPPDRFRVAGFDYLLINTISDEEKKLMDSFEIIQNFPGSKSALLKVK
jgi:hypothetical protein